MFQFFMGVIATILVAAVVVIALLVRENRNLKSKATPTVSNPTKDMEGDKAKSAFDGTASVTEEPVVEKSENKKRVYPDASGIPIDWISSVYKLKNEWVNELATANLIQVKARDIGEVIIIAHCKFVDKGTDGFRLILEDPYDTLKTEPISNKKLTEEQVNGLIGKMLILHGIAENHKFKVKEIKQTIYSRKIV